MERRAGWEEEEALEGRRPLPRACVHSLWLLAFLPSVTLPQTYSPVFFSRLPSLAYPGNKEQKNLLIPGQGMWPQEDSGTHGAVLALLLHVQLIPVRWNDARRGAARHHTFTHACACNA